jgi:hypothetical protein
MSDVIIKKLECDQCGQKAQTAWIAEPDGRSIRPLDLMPHFYERVRLNNERSGTEIACSTCERAIAWPVR